MAGVCILLEKKPKRGTDNYWDASLKLLAKAGKFMAKLKDYDKNNIPEKVINRMKKFLEINKAQFVPDVMAKASAACKGLCFWCLAIYDYYWVYKEITPLRA